MNECLPFLFFCLEGIVFKGVEMWYTSSWYYDAVESLVGAYSHEIFKGYEMHVVDSVIVGLMS